jgi:two-component system, NarL family, sensor histidine kinase FusK
MNSRGPIAGLTRSTPLASSSYTAILSPQNAAVFFTVVLAYYISGKFGQKELAISSTAATAFWPPAGIAIAALFLKGQKALPAIFAGAFLVNLSFGTPFYVACGTGLGNTLEAVAAVVLVGRFASGTRAFFQPRDVLRYAVLAGVVATGLGSFIGTVLTCLSGAEKWSGFGDAWVTWWVGDSLSAIILAPFLILLLGHHHNALGWREWLEAITLLAGLTTACILNFGPPQGYGKPKLFLIIPFLCWAAVRFCPLEVSGACLVMSGFAVWGSLHGYGPYANTTTAPLMMAGYVSIYSLTTMSVAAALFKQKKEIEHLYVLNYGPKSANAGDEEHLAGSGQGPDDEAKDFDGESKE